MQLNDSGSLQLTGHCVIKDDLGNVLLRKSNAIHPQNVARIIARALSNESNFVCNSMAFGNGGTQISANYQITYNPPNDGHPPDPNTWNSRLYHETFRQIVNAEGWPSTPSSGPGTPPVSPLLGTDPGSADENTGVRPGGGAVPADDPPTIPHVSGPGVNSVENGLTSSAVVLCVLNAAEPTGEYLSDVLGPAQAPNGSFSFDEIGLYTTGLQPIASGGYQEVNVNTVSATDSTGLLLGKTYSFTIAVDGGVPQTIKFTTPVAGGSGTAGAILYGDLVVALTTGPASWSPSWTPGTSFLGSSASVTVDNDGTFSPFLLANSAAFGYLVFLSGSTGTTSTISLGAFTLPHGAGTSGNPYNLFDPLYGLNPPTGATLLSGVTGAAAGVQNDPTNSYLECERLLAHLIFSPITKTANRTLIITYTLTISVARTPLIM